VLRSQTVTNVNVDKKTVIVGPSGGKVGTIFAELYMNFSSTDLAVESLCPYLNMTKDECKEFILKDVKNEIYQTKNAKYHVVRYWAQKINDN
jgi:hypothetical protein